MDWTGGTRRRYAVLKNSTTLQKQNAHFAKVRANMQHTPLARTTSQNAPTVTSTPWYTNCSHHELSHGKLRQQVLQNDSHAAPRPSLTRFDHLHTRPDTNGSTERAHRPNHHGLRPINIISDGTSSDEKHNRPVWNPTHMSNTTDDEEVLLHANRRRLLARGDWLSLGPTKPLRMEFPAAGDRDQVGRRRKIKKSGSQKAKLAHRRILTPLFEGRLRPTDYMMGGALPFVEQDECVRIRVGTEAFGDQSSCSRRSKTPTNLPARQPSTQYGLSSEDSMLLGGDGDAFDVDQVLIPASAGTFQHDRYGGSVVANIGGQAFQHANSSPAKMKESALFQNQEEAYQQYDEYGCGLMPSKCSAVKHHGPSKVHLLNEAHEDVTKSHTGERPRLEFSQQVAHLQRELKESTNRNLGRGLLSETSNPESDLAWKKLLGLPSHSPSNASRASFDSSVLHRTASKRAIRSRSSPVEVSAPSVGEQVWTPKDSDTQGSFRHHEIQSSNVNDVASESDHHSSSASLKQVLDLAQRCTAKPNPRTEIVDEDCWRQFVVGSQGSQSSQNSESSEMHGAALKIQLHAKREFVEEALRTGPWVDGDSDHARHGTSLFVTGSTSHSSIAHTGCGPSLGHESSLSEIVTIDSLKTERDSIEDLPPAIITVRKPVNIHATAILNPKRFKRPAKQLQCLAKKTSIRPRALVSSRKQARRTGLHSVYDLVDSDGVSLAP